MKLPKICFCLVGVLFSAGPAWGWQDNASSMPPLPETVVVELTEGASLQAMIAAVDQSSIELIVDSQTQRFAFEQLARLTFRPEQNLKDPGGTGGNEGNAGKVFLVDGTEIIIGDLKIDGRNASIASLGGATIEADVSQLSSIKLLDFEASDQDRAQWKSTMEQPRPTADAIVVSKNGAFQMIEGVVGDIDSEQLTFSMETRTAKVGIEKIKGVVFYRADRELTDAICQMVLIDESKIQVRSLNRSGADIGNGGGNSLEVTTVGGVKFSVDVAQVSRIDFSVGRYVYLSDMVPATNDWTPLLASPEIVDQLKSLRVARFNEDFRGQSIALESIPQQGVEYLGRTESFDKGVAISGGGRVTYSLNRQFKRLTGQVGFDPQAYPGAAVRFVVKTDGQTAISELLKAQDLLQPIGLDLNVSETDRISIAVEYADGKIAGGVLHLADLKVSR